MSDFGDFDFVIEAHGIVTNPPDPDDGGTAEGTVTNPGDDQ